jgi:hypothetical protein
VRAALVEFATRYNETWLVARRGYRTPAQVRADQWQVLSRPSAAEGGGRRPAFTGLATQPYSATEVDGWQHKLSRVSQNRAAVHQRIGLDGSPAEMVDAEAKELATRQMAQLEARKAAKKAAETARAAVVKPKPAPTRPTESILRNLRRAWRRST